MKLLHKLMAAVLVICLLPVSVSAQEGKARDLSGVTAYSGSGYSDFSFLKDGNFDGFRTSDAGCTLNLDSGEGMGSLYLYFDLEPEAYTVTDRESGASVTAGGQGILHEFLDLEAAFGRAPAAVTVQFAGAVRLSEVCVFSPGQTPDYVQKWEAPLEGGADIVLFSTHSDDDQLFFAGLVPLYAGEKGCRVQVVLMTDHREGPYGTHARVHEVINGLWATGLTAHPVFGDFVDNRIDDISGMYGYYAGLGITRDHIQSFVVEQLRRFKPLVAIGHDLDGEYGHGMHKIYAEMLASGVSLADDPGVYPDSAARYGTWQVQKTYLHLYAENPIVLNYDVPLERFGGLTAFQASQKLGFPCHHTQQWTDFRRWLNGDNGEITAATQITTYNPAYFGLYQTAVGPDVQKNDFLENIVTYAQQDANAAKAVDDGIQASPVEAEALAAARAAYEALTAGQKEMVTALDVLLEKEEALQKLQAQQAADEAAAGQVDEMIAGLPQQIRLADEKQILAVQTAYDDLSQEQKALVTQLDALEAARETLRQLQEEKVRQQELEKQADVRRLVTILVCLIAAAVVLICVLIYAQCRRRSRRRRRR